MENSSSVGRLSDPAWVHFKRFNSKRGLPESAICLYCDKSMTGITDCKAHLAGIGSRVKHCRKVPQNVRNEIAELLNGSSFVQNKSDPAWIHFKRVVDETGKLQAAICLYCDRRIGGGGITRSKEHLAGTSGHVKPCPKVPHNVKDQMVELVKSKAAKEKKAKDRGNCGITKHKDEGSSSVRGKQRDSAWVHLKRVDSKTGKQNCAICLYCDKRMDGGGIFRYKHHLAGIRGHGTTCPYVPQHVKNEIIELLKGVKGEKAKGGDSSNINVGSEGVKKKNVKKRKYSGSSSESEEEFESSDSEEEFEISEEDSSESEKEFESSESEEELEEISEKDSEPGLDEEGLCRTKRNGKKEINYDLSNESDEISEKNVVNLDSKPEREENSLRVESKGKTRKYDLCGEKEEESEKIIEDLEPEPVREEEPSRDEKKKGEKKKYSLCGENSKKICVNERSKESDGVTTKQLEPERKKEKGPIKQFKARVDNSLVRPTHHNRRMSRRRGNDDKQINTHLFEPFLEDLWSKIPEKKRHSFMYFGSLWFSTYMHESKQKVIHWIKKLKEKVFAKKYVFVPIVCWSHWSLLVLCNFGTKDPCMILLDSLSKAGPERLEIDIRRFIVDIYRVEEREENEQFISEIPLMIPKVPQQTSNDDCGAYVLYYISNFIEKAPRNFSQDGFPYFLTQDWFTKEDIETFQKEIDTFSMKQKLEEELPEKSYGECQVYRDDDVEIVEID